MIIKAKIIDSITVLNLEHSLNFSIDASVFLLGQIIAKAKHLKLLNIGGQEKRKIGIFISEESIAFYWDKEQRCTLEEGYGEFRIVERFEN